MSKLLDFFGLVKKSKHQEALDALRSRAEEAMLLKEKILKLEVSIHLRPPLPTVNADVADPSPVSGGDRQAFAARVAAFHFDILGPKLKRMVADTRDVLMSIDRDSFGFNQGEFDIYLKGTENAYWLLYEWGELLLSEHKSNAVGDTLSDEEKQGLQDKLDS